LWRWPSFAYAFCLALAVVSAGRDAPASPRNDAAQKLAQAEQMRAARERDRVNAARALQVAQAEALALGERRMQAAAGLREAERRVSAASDLLRQAQGTEADAEAALMQREAAFLSLVPLMLRMARYPAETVLAVPMPADRALQALLLTNGLAATLNREAADLRAQEAEAAHTREMTAKQEAALDAERRQEAAAAAALDAAIAETRAKISVAEAEGQRAAEAAAALAAQASTLREAIAAMDAARAAAASKAAQEAAEAEKHRQAGVAATARARQAALSRPTGKGGIGRLVAPVSGPVLRAFGAPEADGTATGITYATVPGAFVASPCTGRVGFAAPFRSYGQLVILECGGGMDMVLAGLGHIDTAPGRAVRASEPIGRMPELGSSPGAGHPPLYVELRAAGKPVNPLPFLNARG